MDFFYLSVFQVGRRKKKVTSVEGGEVSSFIGVCTSFEGVKKRWIQFRIVILRKLEVKKPR